MTRICCPRPASNRLTGALQAEEQRSGIQLVVVTLPGLQGREIEDYGFQLGRAWGIGQKGKNNGALLIVAPAEHRARIEVGYGLEGTLTDGATAAIVNAMTPAFKAGQYDQGIVQGTEAVLTVLQGGEPPVEAAPTQDEHAKFPALLLIGLVVLMLCFPAGRSFLTTMLIFSSFGGGRGGSGGGGFGGGGGSFGGGGASGRW